MINDELKKIRGKVTGKKEERRQFLSNEHDTIVRKIDGIKAELRKL